MNLFRIASRVVLASDFDFKTKMMVNALVLEQIARESGNDDLNSVAEGIMGSDDIHKKIQELAKAIHEEAMRLKSSKSQVACDTFKLIYGDLRKLLV